MNLHSAICPQVEAKQEKLKGLQSSGPIDPSTSSSRSPEAFCGICSTDSWLMLTVALPVVLVRVVAVDGSKGILPSLKPPVNRLCRGAGTAGEAAQALA
jgi:hypothetical protein